MHNTNQLHKVILAIILYGIILLTIRISITESTRYLFLVWNLFLAIIPFAISTGLKHKKLPTYVRWIGIALWLLFLPNAPYILTDFIHLKSHSAVPIWLDILLIASFAISGLTFYLLSLNDIYQLVYNRFSKKHAQFMVLSVSFLTGFGVFIGRTLRWNSWDILQQPNLLFMDILHLVSRPLVNFEAWMVIFNFSIFFLLIYWAFSVFQLRVD